MEYPLTLKEGIARKVIRFVLILILMEYPLTYIWCCEDEDLKSLNPYSNGIPSDLLSESTLQLLKL